MWSARPEKVAHLHLHLNNGGRANLEVQKGFSMVQKKIKATVSLWLTIIFLVACSSPSIPSPTEPSINRTQVPEANATAATTEPSATLEYATPTAANGLCTNAYYPVREGATWSYKSTGGPAGEYSFTDTITSVREDGFTLSTKIDGLTRNQEWSCKPEGLVALQFGGAPAAMLNAQNIQLELKASNINGVTFPSQINIGDQWQQTTDVDGKVTVSNQEGTAKGTAQMKFHALGNESVTVPAGKFEAVKIQVDTTLNVNAKYEGLSLPVKFSGSYTYWFVKDVGWIKATGTGSVAGMLFSETTELQSYNVP